MGLHLVFMCINLYYWMPGWMIVGLNEQLLTLTLSGQVANVDPVKICRLAD